MSGTSHFALPVLIVDDHPDVRLALRMLLRSEGISSVEVDSPAAARDAVSLGDFACAVLDLNFGADTTSGNEGLDLVASIRQELPDLPLVVMTAWGKYRHRGTGDASWCGGFHRKTLEQCTHAAHHPQPDGLAHHGR